MNFYREGTRFGDRDRSEDLDSGQLEPLPEERSGQIDPYS